MCVDPRGGLKKDTPVEREGIRQFHSIEQPAPLFVAQHVKHAPHSLGVTMKNRSYWYDPYGPKSFIGSLVVWLHTSLFNNYLNKSYGMGLALLDQKTSSIPREEDFFGRAVFLLTRWAIKLNVPLHALTDLATIFSFPFFSITRITVLFSSITLVSAYYTINQITYILWEY